MFETNEESKARTVQIVFPETKGDTTTAASLELVEKVGSIMWIWNTN